MQKMFIVTSGYTVLYSAMQYEAADNRTYFWQGNQLLVKLGGWMREGEGKLSYPRGF